MKKDKILFIFSRYHMDPKNIHHKCGTGVAQLEILGTLENLGYDVYFGGQEDFFYPKEYITESKAIIYIAPAFPKFIKYRPTAKLILFANNSHVLVRNQRMRDSAKKWALDAESLGQEKFFLPAYKYSDFILVAGNKQVFNTFTKNGVPEEKLQYWHNSVNASIYKPGKEKYKDFTFVHWSSEVGLRKGLPAILAAWKKWNHPKARLIIMGILTKDGKKLLYKRNWFGWPKLALPKNVVFYGSKRGFPSQDPYVLEVLSKSHVGIFPTLEDNQPAAAMEMAASGLPLIITEESGFELNPSWCYKVTMDDVDSLTESLNVAYLDPNLEQKGKNAREFMIKNHNWDDFRKQFAQFIKSVL